MGAISIFSSNIPSMTQDQPDTVKHAYDGVPGMGDFTLI